MPRLFLAAPLPGEVREKIGKKISLLKNSLPDWQVNWVSPENLHITLVFFGWIKEEQILKLKREISRSVTNFPSFQMKTGKIAVAGRPIWFEVEDGQEKIQRIAENLSENLTTRGSLEEAREFHPHLTLGRIKKRGKSRLPKVASTFSWKVERLVLYESKFIRKERIYKEIFSFLLD